MGTDRGWLRLNSRQRERWRSRKQTRETSKEEVSINMPDCRSIVELDDSASTAGRFGSGYR